MTIRRYTLLLLLSVCSSALFAGNPPADFTSQFIEANKLMEEKFWNKSISAWSQLYTMDNTNANINYKLGYCYLQTANSKEKALEYLKNAAAFPTSKKYDPYNPGERRAPADAIYYLGLAYHLNYDLDMAVGSYNDFLKLVPKNHILAIKARHGIEQCENAKKEMGNPRNYVITNVGPVINDTTNDFSPVLSIDESAMFFTSRRLRKDTTWIPANGWKTFTFPTRTVTEIGWSLSCSTSIAMNMMLPSAFRLTDKPFLSIVILPKVAKRQTAGFSKAASSVKPGVIHYCWEAISILPTGKHTPLFHLMARHCISLVIVPADSAGATFSNA
jgi:hypothetical protein